MAADQHSQKATEDLWGMGLHRERRLQTEVCLSKISLSKEGFAYGDETEDWDIRWRDFVFLLHIYDQNRSMAGMRRKFICGTEKISSVLYTSVGYRLLMNCDETHTWSQGDELEVMWYRFKPTVEVTTITMCGIFGKTVNWNLVIWHCDSFYLMRKQHPTPQIMDLKRSTPTRPCALRQL